jgi:hypothetical protein
MPKKLPGEIPRDLWGAGGALAAALLVALFMRVLRRAGQEG